MATSARKRPSSAAPSATGAASAISAAPTSRSFHTSSPAKRTMSRTTKRMPLRWTGPSGHEQRDWPRGRVEDACRPRSSPRAREADAGEQDHDEPAARRDLRQRVARDGERLPHRGAEAERSGGARDRHWRDALARARRATIRRPCRRPAPPSACANRKLRWSRASTAAATASQSARFTASIAGKPMSRAFCSAAVQYRCHRSSVQRARAGRRARPAPGCRSGCAVVEGDDVCR